MGPAFKNENIMFTSAQDAVTCLHGEIVNHNDGDWSYRGLSWIRFIPHYRGIEACLKDILGICEPFSPAKTRAEMIGLILLGISAGKRDLGGLMMASSQPGITGASWATNCAFFQDLLYREAIKDLTILDAKEQVSGEEVETITAMFDQYKCTGKVIFE